MRWFVDPLEVDELVYSLWEVGGYKTSGLEVQVHGLVANLGNFTMKCHEIFEINSGNSSG